MNWIVSALFAQSVITVVIFIDKYIVSKEVNDYRGMPIYTTIMGFVAGAVFWIISGFPILALRDAIIVIATGMLTIWAAALYFEAVSLEDASKLTLLFQMSPAFTLIMAVLFLKENISFSQLLGFVLIFGAAIWVSVEKGNQKFKLSRTFWLILIVDLMWAVAAILIKFALDANSFAKILSFESWGLGIGGTILYFGFSSIRDAFHESIRTVRRRALGIMFANEGIFVIAKSINYFAYSIGPAALVSVVGSTSVFFGILYGLVLTLFVPKLIKENILTEEMSKKLFAAIMLISGLWLVYK